MPSHDKFLSNTFCLKFRTSRITIFDEHPMTVPPSMNDLYNETITFTTVDYAEIFNYLNSDDNSSSLYEDSYSDDTSIPDVDM